MLDSLISCFGGEPIVTLRREECPAQASVVDVAAPDESTVAFFSGKESDLGLNGFTQSILTWGHRDVGTIPAVGGPRQTITACTPVTTAAELQAFPAGACLASDNPAWSPDGKSLLYDRGSPNAGDSGTWMIDLDGHNMQRLSPDTRGAGTCR